MPIPPMPPLPALPHVPIDRYGSGDPLTGLSAVDRSIFRRHRPSMMLVGPASATEALLLQLEPSFADPLTLWQPGAELALPSAGGTLLLRKVSALTAAQQSTLLDWFDRDQRRTQVISTASQSLLPLLERGLFSDVLYYRLNPLYVELPEA
jgi:hypothetical protein